MQAQAYEGYFESGKFYAAGKPIHIPERRKVYITILDEPSQISLSATMPDWLDELHRLLEESGDEKLRMEDFPRMDFGREPIFFSDEGDLL
jgi:hypothetical protein